MTSTGFAQQMEFRWRQLIDDAARSRDPNLATFGFYDWYRALSSEERRLADEQLAEWVQSVDDRRQFDALEMIGEFRIASARPSIERLIQALPEGQEAKTRILRSKLRRLLNSLGSSRLL